MFGGVGLTARDTSVLVLKTLSMGVYFSRAIDDDEDEYEDGTQTTLK
jgi:hypothetical protein